MVICTKPVVEARLRTPQRHERRESATSATQIIHVHAINDAAMQSWSRPDAHATHSGHNSTPHTTAPPTPHLPIAHFLFDDRTPPAVNTAITATRFPAALSLFLRIHATSEARVVLPARRTCSVCALSSVRDAVHNPRGAAMVVCLPPRHLLQLNTRFTCVGADPAGLSGAVMARLHHSAA
jgi:hypothetical protein